MTLVPLSKARDYDLEADTLDVRGWEVRTELDNEKVGKVDDLLLDDRGQPRFLDLDLGLLRKHVLIPIGQARVDRSLDRVWIPDMAREQFEVIPAYNHKPESLTPSYMERLNHAYSSTRPPERYATPERYSGEHTQEPREREARPEVRERLMPLSELKNFSVSDQDPDPRGWKVLGADGIQVGKVAELVIDTTSLKARYLDCELDEKELGMRDRDRHLLIPVGRARLEQKEKHVIVDELTSADIRALPGQERLPRSDEDEREIEDAFRGSRTGGETDWDADPRYSAERFYADRDRSRTPAPEDAGDRLEQQERAREDLREGEPRGEQRAESGTADVDRQVVRTEDDRDLRIRVRDDEIIVERRPREE